MPPSINRSHTKRPTCPAACPVAAARLGCGFLDAGTQCAHPAWRRAVENAQTTARMAAERQQTRQETRRDV